MNHNGPVVVKKSSFLSAIAFGFFGTLAIVIICAASVAFYAVNVIDRKTNDVFNLGSNIITALPELEEALPPVVSDALNDRRAPNYRQEVNVTARFIEGEHKHNNKVVFDVSNNGDELITMLALRGTLVDESGTIVRSFISYPATPLAIDNDWPGPLMPGSNRQIGINIYHHADLNNAKVTVELADLRVWNDTANEQSSINPELAKLLVSLPPLDGD